MRLKKLFTTLILTVFPVVFASCASQFQTTPVTPEQQRFTYNAPFDKVWATTIQVLSDLEYPILHTEKESGLIVTDWVIFPENSWTRDDSKLISTSKLYEKKRAKLNINIWKVSENQTKVVIKPHIEAWHGSSWQPVESSGYLEHQILQAIKERLSQ